MIRIRLGGCSHRQDMSLRAGGLCSAPDSAFNSPLFHGAAGYLPHASSRHLYIRASAVMSATNNTELFKRGAGGHLSTQRDGNVIVHAPLDQFASDPKMDFS